MNPRRSATRACPTARASTSLSRRWPSTAPALTIRKFKKDKLTLDQLVKFGSMTPAAPKAAQDHRPRAAATC
jgi:type IV secretory pathway ATPase VirB11/archaellum biosynthesis ATPase